MTRYRITLVWTVTCILALGLWSGVGFAQTGDKPEFTLKVSAIGRNVPQWALFEQFERDVERNSSGRIAVELTTNPELGVATFDMVRIMKSGVIDIGNIVPLHVSGEVPLLEATELPGLFPDVATNREAFEKWTAEVLLKNQERIGGRVIGSFGWAGQVLFSKKPVADLSDLKGMKIRVSSRSMSDYITAFGGIPVTIAMDELSSSLQMGTVDGVTTAAATGFGLGLWESTKAIVDLGIGTPTGLLVANLKVWERLPPDLQKVLEKAGEAFTEAGWMQSMTLEQKGIDQNKERGMTYLPAKGEWRPALEKARQQVLEKWGDRAGAQAKAAFNNVLAPYTGTTVK